MGRGTREAGEPHDREEKRFPTDGNPPRKGLMGGERPDEAQGCRVMGKK